MALEIERKWLGDSRGVQDRYPDARWYDEKYKEVIYLIASEDLDVRISKTWRPGNELRVVYKLVIKRGRDLAREEIKYTVDEEAYEQARRLVSRPPVIKHLKKYSFEGHTIEENTVDDEWVYYEIEYPTVEAAHQDPISLGKEVTGDYQYSMSYYWRNGLNG